MPLRVSAVTMTPAMTTPSPMRGIARRAGMLKTQAAREPLQAPVIGSGMATTSTRARSPYL